MLPKLNFRTDGVFPLYTVFPYILFHSLSLYKQTAMGHLYPYLSYLFYE